MLISHRKQFIVTKGKKTAGTSVESFFERFCMPEGAWERLHDRPEHVSEAGIIGHRGRHVRRSTWRNHMTAAEIRDLIGQDVWDRYFKFTVIRNPFDKLISLFYWLENRKDSYTLKRKGKALLARLTPLGNPIDRIKGDTDIERFRAWIAQGGTVEDRETYLIDGEPCLDDYIRFECLHEDIKRICDQLDLPYDADALPRFKAGIRPDRAPIADFYDAETEALVRARFAWEFEAMNYDMPVPGSA
ncbi:MAG: sulfotransferase family 2 domain-containing protein [Phycisphaerales bacterium]|jgi:hypothetical protein|nr:sulfotransferase family 2 domain-containing protein [Phycisphaerales bacterium]